MAQNVIQLRGGDLLSWSPPLKTARLAIPPRLQPFVIGGGDVLALSLAFLAALLMSGAWRSPGISSTDAWATVGFTALWILMFILFGTYSTRHAIAGLTEYRRMLYASVVSAGVIGSVFYLLSYDYPRVLMVAWILTGIFALGLMRFVRRHAIYCLHRADRFTSKVLLVGGGNYVDEIAKVLHRESWLGYRVGGVLSDDGVVRTSGGLKVLGKIDDLPAVVVEESPAAVVFAEGSFGSTAEYRRLAWQFERSKVRLILAPTLSDVSAERLDFNPVAGLPLVDVGPPKAMKSLRWFKRGMDIAGASILLILMSPLLLLTVIAIKLEDGGPVLFRQQRVGLDGSVFGCLKFRSMCVDAEAKLAELMAANEGSGPLFKMKEDPRITRVGKFIRRYSVDELPQFWNVLIGDMSLVGPRPALPSEVEQYEDDARRRLRIRPGLTGLWQVSGRSRLSWEDTVRLDLYYVDNWSIVQDIVIMLRTAKAVLGSSGAY